MDKKIECKGCKEGIQMCKTRPCWGTVEDFKKIIEAGFAKKLMIDYYNSESVSNNKKIYFLSGASNGNDCSKADWDPRGVCALLENDLCVVHEIKLTIGAIACCKNESGFRDDNEKCIATWDSPEGNELIEKWKVLVEYVEKNDDEGFSFMGAMDLMFGFSNNNFKIE